MSALSSKYSSIVVGIDFSQPSLQALREAVRIVSGSKAKIIACHFLHDEEMQHLTRCNGLEESAILDGRRTHMLSWIEKSGIVEKDIDFLVRVEIGHPSTGLTNTAKKEAASLLILGAQGENHKDRDDLIGIVSRSCSRRTPCDLLLVRRAHTDPFRTILAAIDFSENSKTAVQHAVEIAHSDNADLHVVYVFAPEWKNYGDQDDFTESIENYKADLRKQFCDYAYSELEEVKGTPVHFDIHESSHAIQGILQYAQQISADLVVVGTVGRSSADSAPLGTTAESVIAKSACSVLMVADETP